MITVFFFILILLQRAFYEIGLLIVETPWAKSSKLNLIANHPMILHLGICDGDQGVASTRRYHMEVTP
jgi:hypothetical protein